MSNIFNNLLVLISAYHKCMGVRSSKQLTYYGNWFSLLQELAALQLRAETCEPLDPLCWKVDCLNATQVLCKQPRLLWVREYGSLDLVLRNLCSWNLTRILESSSLPPYSLSLVGRKKDMVSHEWLSISQTCILCFTSTPCESLY